METSIDVFSCQKAGNSIAEYEDASGTNDKSETSHSKCEIRLAVADGATESSYSASWAQLLVQDYGICELTKKSLKRRLPILRQQWIKDVGKKPLAWYAEEKLRSGAFSTLLGLTISPGPSKGSWRALAVGDSCLFHMRDDILKRVFPLGNAEDFDNRPVLVSASEGDESHRSAIKTINGTWQEGDIFYLMTDALACWFLTLHKGSKTELLRKLSTCSKCEFQDMVDTQRTERMEGGRPRLKNDDVTLVRCCIVPTQVG